MEKSRYKPTLTGGQPCCTGDTAEQIHYLALPSEQPQITCFAESIEELTGYNTDEILADRELWINLIHPADQQKLFSAFTRCKNWAISFEIEYRIIHNDGSLRYVIDKGRPVLNDRGQITHIEGTITDISKTKKTEDTY